MIKEFEPKFDINLFPKKDEQRARKFDTKKKKYVLITSRVHPGETSASYVFKGVIDMLLS